MEMMEVEISPLVMPSMIVGSVLEASSGIPSDRVRCPCGSRSIARTSKPS